MDDDAGEGSGSVYVYERIPGSSWEYRQKLIGDDTESYDNFGYSVSVNESEILVGAFNEDGVDVDTGAAYVFSRDEAGRWNQMQKIVSGSLGSHDRFGFSVDIDGDWLAVSSRDYDDSGSNSGSVQLYRRNEIGIWEFTLKLIPPAESPGAYFGCDIALDGISLVVGSKGDSSQGTGVDSTYVYQNVGDDWVYVTKLLPETFSNYDGFGSSVAIEGESILVGVPNADGQFTDSGAAALYRYLEGQWVEVETFVPTVELVGTRFGSDVALRDSRAGAIGRTESGGSSAGYVFQEYDSGDWELKVGPDEVLGAALEGSSIALSAGVACVGNPANRRFDSLYDVPQALESFRIANVSPAGVRIAWTDHEDSLGEVVVDRREYGSNEWRMLATVNASSQSFLDSQAKGGTRWEYRARRLGGGLSSPSEAVATEMLATGKLVNLSTRGFVGKGERVLISGFTVLGSNSLEVSIRARGPSLLEYEVPNPILDPRLSIIPLGGSLLGTNADWFQDYSIEEMYAFESETGAASVQLYAPEPVYLDTLPSGVYTAVVEDEGGSTGLGLAEVFETPREGSFSSVSALLNLSARGYVNRGAEVLIGGFVIAGDGPVEVMIRGIGPGLSDQGVSDIVDDPRITLYQAGGDLIVSNRDWGTGGQVAELLELSERLGAFDLKLGSADACLVVTLPPGLYTCILDSETSDSGVGLLEIYLVE